MVQEYAPRVQTHTEAVYTRLLECVLVKQVQELQHGEQRVKLHPLQVGGHKPVEEVGTFSQKPKCAYMTQERD